MKTNWVKVPQYNLRRIGRLVCNLKCLQSSTSYINKFKVASCTAPVKIVNNSNYFSKAKTGVVDKDLTRYNYLSYEAVILMDWIAVGCE